MPIEPKGSWHSKNNNNSPKDASDLSLGIRHVQLSVFSYIVWNSGKKKLSE